MGTHLNIGLDLHGVIDSNINMFSTIMRNMLSKYHNVYIITGSEVTEELVDYIVESNIPYNRIFSITSFHKKLGTPIKYKNDDLNHPIIDDEIWNRTKSVICDTANIDVHIDDSEIYGRYFYGKCKYIKFTSIQSSEFLKLFL